MKKRFLYAAVFAGMLSACADEQMTVPSVPSDEQTEVIIPSDATSGELLIKFKPEMTDILDQTLTRASRSGSTATRSGIPSTDEVLNILGGYHFERIFPVDEQNEERTRKAGLHLWYLVKFDENTDLKKAAEQLKQLGEISKVQSNGHIKRAYNNKKRVYFNENALSTRAAGANEITLPFKKDPGFDCQWHYYNSGDYDFENKNPNNATAIEGCDINVVAAWEKCTGNPSIIVAVLDEGVMHTHPDLKANMWVNEKEVNGTAGKDNDGNGYKNDKHGYNFVNNTGLISWTDADDSGHGTHVAGTIAAVNGNGIGVSGIAGGNSPEGNGVKIMSCQVFSGLNGVTLTGEARAIKYAADNGAVILQCSWGMNSALANPIEGYVPGPATEKEWAETYPLEKEAIDYFINNAGSPNGVIDGGVAIFAAGNEYAGIPAFPSAYSKVICVGATAADFTPASYTNYGEEVSVSAPGGDFEYYGKIGENDKDQWLENETNIPQGSILSTCIKNGQPAYAYMDGTSMACPHVSGVAALGLSYAVKQRRHFKAEEFIELLKTTARDDFYHKYDEKVEKMYYYNHATMGASATLMDLIDRKGKMGKLVDAGALLGAIDGAGSDMKVPNVYVATGKKATIDLARYFKEGETLTYTCTGANESIAKTTVNGTMLIVEGVADGSTKATIQAGSQSQAITITVRKNAGGNGWL